MKNENEKKGLFDRLIRGEKAKKSSCCGNFQIEEIPEENNEDKSKKKSQKDKGTSCCK